MSIISHLTNLKLSFNPIENITLVQDPAFYHLQTITLGGIPIDDYSFLANYGQLTLLQVYDTPVRDTSFLTPLTSLTFLDLRRTGRSEIAVLANLSNLQILYLDGNQITDLNPLSSLTNLTTLRMASNPIGDLSVLAGLTNLTYLDANDVLATDISPLVDLTKLTTLKLRDNQIADLSPLGNLTLLATVDLQKNLIVDVSPLCDLTKLTSLNLLSNPLNPMSYAIYLPAIQANNPELDLQVDVSAGPLPGFAEGFESGQLAAGVWQSAGNLPWFVTSDQKYSGKYSARAGAIGHGQISTLKITGLCVAGSFSFLYKTSTEAGDKLVFKVDGQEKLTRSGESLWMKVTLAIAAGTHTFEWSYVKNASVSAGQDTVWLDNITFP